MFKKQLGKLILIDMVIFAASQGFQDLFHYSDFVQGMIAATGGIIAFEQVFKKKEC